MLNVFAIPCRSLTLNWSLVPERLRHIKVAPQLPFLELAIAAQFPLACWDHARVQACAVQVNSMCASSLLNGCASQHFSDFSDRVF